MSVILAGALIRSLDLLPEDYRTRARTMLNAHAQAQLSELMTEPLATPNSRNRTGYYPKYWVMPYDRETEERINKTHGFVDDHLAEIALLIEWAGLELPFDMDDYFTDAMNSHDSPSRKFVWWHGQIP